MRRKNTVIYRKQLALMLIVALLTGLLLPQKTEAQGTDYGLRNPRIGNLALGESNTWDCVYFGHYWQSDTNDDGLVDRDDAKEPILWRVLWVDGDDAFLLAERNMEFKQYNPEWYDPVTWQTSTMRSWLNGYGRDVNQCGIDYTGDNFLDNAFSPSEQAAIRETNVENRYNADYNTEGGADTTDKLYLLSFTEATTAKYGFSTERYTNDTRRAKDTDYVWETSRNGRRRGLSLYKTTAWWLRSSGDIPADFDKEQYGSGPYPSDRAMLVRQEISNNDASVCGHINTDGDVAVQNRAVRPVLHLDLSQRSCWTYAGTVSVNPIEENLSPAPTPVETPVRSEQPAQTPESDPLFPGTNNTPVPPVTGDNGVTTWDCVYFGHYWQSDTNQDGTANRKDAKEKIKWRVLSVDGDDVLLLADKVIAYQPYNETWVDITWANSTMRSWLNGYDADANLYGKNYTHNNFLDYAFSASEQSAIKDTALVNADNEKHGTEGGEDTTDQVYLLAENDMANPAYGFSDDLAAWDKGRCAKKTEYVETRGAISGWWLRSPGDGNKSAESVESDIGYVSYGNIDDVRISVRPALHLNLAYRSCWSNAGQVTSDGKVIEPATPTPAETPSAEPSVSSEPTEGPSVSQKPTEAPDATGLPTESGEPMPSVIPSAEPAVSQKPTEVPDADAVTYDAAEFEPFAGRTKEEAAAKYIAARYADQGYEEADSTSFYETRPSFESPYYPGLLSEAALKTMYSMCNYYRWLAGTKEIQGSMFQDSYGWDSMQKQAFLAHFPGSMPEDFPEEEWEKLKTYAYSFAQGNTPLEGLNNLMNAKVMWGSRPYETYRGRQFILSPNISDIDMGYSGSWLVSPKEVSEVYNKEDELPFYAFPSEGYMPDDLLKTDGSAWSVELNQAVIGVSLNSVSITISHRESGQKIVRSSSDENVYVFPSGEYNSGKIYFEGPVSEGMSVYTGTYDVEITGLTDVATGKGAKVCYTVHFFDTDDYLNQDVKEVSLDGITKYIVPESIATTDNLQKLASILPDEVTVTGDNGRNLVLPVKGKWVYDAAGSCWKNSADAAELPSGLTDTAGMLSEFSIACEVGDNRGLAFEMRWGDLEWPTDGKGGTIEIKWNETSKIDHAMLYQITENEQGYTAGVRYDPEKAWSGNLSEVENAFVFQSDYHMADAGEYVAVGYVDGEKTAYLSGNMKKLIVLERGTPQIPGGGGNNSGTGNASGGISGGTGGNAGGNTAGGNSGTVGSGGAGDNSLSSGGNAVPKVAKVKKFKAKAQKKRLLLTWKKNPKASGYQIQISTKKNFKKAKKISVKKSKTKYKIAKLKQEKKYYVRIRAYQSYKTRDGKKKKAYGKWVVKRSRILK